MFCFLFLKGGPLPLPGGVAARAAPPGKHNHETLASSRTHPSRKDSISGTCNKEHGAGRATGRSRRALEPKRQGRAVAIGQPLAPVARRRAEAGPSACRPGPGRARRLWRPEGGVQSDRVGPAAPALRLLQIGACCKRQRSRRKEIGSVNPPLTPPSPPPPPLQVFG